METVPASGLTLERSYENQGGDAVVGKTMPSKLAGSSFSKTSTVEGARGIHRPEQAMAQYTAVHTRTRSATPPFAQQAALPLAGPAHRANATSAFGVETTMSAVEADSPRANHVQKLGDSLQSAPGTLEVVKDGMDAGVDEDVHRCESSIASPSESKKVAGDGIATKVQREPLSNSEPECSSINTPARDLISTSVQLSQALAEIAEADHAESASPTISRTERASRDPDSASDEQMSAHSLSPEIEEILPPSSRRKRQRSTTDTASSSKNPQRVRRARLPSSAPASDDEDLPLRGPGPAKHSAQEDAMSLADSQEPPTLASTSSQTESSDEASSIPVESGSEGEHRRNDDLQRPEVFEEDDTSDDAMFKDPASRRVAQELAQIKKECEPFFPRNSTTPPSAVKRKKKIARRKHVEDVSEEPLSMTGRYTAKQKGKGREVIRSASESEPETQQEEEVLSLHGSDESDSDEALMARPARSKPRPRGTRPGGRNLSGVASHRRIKLRVLPPVRCSILPVENGVSIGSSKARPGSKAASSDRTAANPAAYTRSRTAAGDQAQCHRCEAFHPKSISFKCCTCSSGVCQRCLIEHYSDQNTYMALLAYLLSQLKEDIRVAQKRQIQSRKKETLDEDIEGPPPESDSEMPEPVAVGCTDQDRGVELDGDGLDIAGLKEKFRLPPNLDLSTFDFQCPACKFICTCANCLRGPYPVGHPLHKASLVAATSHNVGIARARASRLRAPERPLSRSYSTDSHDTRTHYEDSANLEEEDEEEDGFEVSSRPFGRACLPPITVSDEDLYHTKSPSKPLAGPLSRRQAIGRARSPPATNYISSHAEEAAAQARAIREQMDAESDFIPVVSSRKRSTRRIPNNGRNNAVPRFGSPPRHTYYHNNHMEIVEDTISPVAELPAPPPVRRSERVRLATRVGQQLGKTPAGLTVPEG